MSKILFFDFNMPYLIQDKDLPVGGATVQAYYWILGLLAHGQEVGVLIPDNINTNIEKRSNIKFLKTFTVIKNDSVLKWLYPRYSKLNFSIHQFKPKYIYQAGSGFITWILAYISKKKNIIFIHRIANDADTDERIKQRLPFFTRIFYEYGLRNADKIICQNKYQYKNIKKRFPNKSVMVIHNPYFCEFVSNDIVLFKDRNYIAWLGVFQKQKNLPALLYIVKKLPNVMFKIAGKCKKGIDSETKNTIEELKKFTNVTFVGYLKRTEINKFLSNSYALLNTSHYEGFSNTFLEAFAAGTPVISLKGVDPDRIISNNRLGYVCNDYTEIPKLIKRMLNNKHYFDLCVRCQQYVFKSHNHIFLTKKLIEFLKTT